MSDRHCGFCGFCDLSEEGCVTKPASVFQNMREICSVTKPALDASRFCMEALPRLLAALDVSRFFLEALTRLLAAMKTITDSSPCCDIFIVFFRM